MGHIAGISGLSSASAYSSGEDVFIDNMLALGAPDLLGTLQRLFVKLYTLFKCGWGSSDLCPQKQIAALPERPALIMHSTEDSQVPFANFQRITAQASAHVPIFVQEGDQHFISTDFCHPESALEYMTLILWQFCSKGAS